MCHLGYSLKSPISCLQLFFRDELILNYKVMKIIKNEKHHMINIQILFAFINFYIRIIFVHIHFFFAKIRNSLD